MRERNRFPTLTRKANTPFSVCYLHVHFDPVTGYPCGGSISDPQKEPDAQVARLIRALSEALDETLQHVNEHVAAVKAERERAQPSP